MTAQWLSVPRRLPSAYHDGRHILEWSKLRSARRATEWRKMMGATSVSALLPANGYQSCSDLLDTALGSQKIELRSGIARISDF